MQSINFTWEKRVEEVKMMEQKRSLISVEQGSLTSLTPKRHKADMPFSAKERKDKVGERIAALQQLVSPFGKTDTASVLQQAMEYISFLHDQVKKKVHFLLTLKIVYVLSQPKPNEEEDETVEQTRQRTKWETDDYPCCGHILNALVDNLFDLYQNVGTAKNLWDTHWRPNILWKMLQVLSAPYLHNTSAAAATIEESESQNLRNKGLCLVPVSCATGVASSNGADIWAPIKNHSPKFSKASLNVTLGSEKV